LTVGGAFVLIGTTGFTPTCQALHRMGMPQVFTTQLLFLYRYIFVLAEEAGRTSLARELRSCGTKGQGIESYRSLIGALLLRTWGRAERIHDAMLARGFNGEFHRVQSNGFGRMETIYCFGWSALFILFRLTNIPLVLGNFITGLFA
jgi:cobalt/nickel transport system permease protein